MSKRDKHSGPAVRREPPSSKNPKKSKDPVFAEDRPLAWRFSSCDKDGPWAWAKLDCTVTHKKVIERLQEFEHMNMAQLRLTESHPISIDNLHADARKRLEEIQRDDIDELYSLRILGRQRVFCIRESNIMKVLWWDPEHQVCPSHKKGT